MAKHYENIENSMLLELIPISDFRLIREEQRKIFHGYSEIPVTIDLKKTFADDLGFQVPWDNELYGFVKCKQKLFLKTGYDNTGKITISDWENKIILIFEGSDGTEGPIYAVEKTDLKELLEKCMKPKKLY